ncbi:hypothetical protein J2Z22_001345 [Paenibacillus forsythiae]|uniref:Tc1-like transposase DDE domain-containing protein n=1 Tax=Paenibacillus forsythiae TaxID=365616 RepID=A0ABU3H527_9BACL|nr:hypothetical protein [Paenibacillus forsythiae]MDT3425826.1 hypothetical protein [Paenibacillus forsythiae]
MSLHYENLRLTRVVSTKDGNEHVAGTMSASLGRLILSLTLNPELNLVEGLWKWLKSDIIIVNSKYERRQKGEYNIF